MIGESSDLPPQLVQEALSPPPGGARLALLAGKLRAPRVWVAICRVATQQTPEWLEDRLVPGDSVVEMLGAVGDPQRDISRARAVVEIALVLCGRRDERDPLLRCAEITDEPAVGALADLDPQLHPRLLDLVADLRGPRRGVRKVSVTTIVAPDGHGQHAAVGTASAYVVPGRVPGVRLETASRLFAVPDPALEASVAEVAAQIGNVKRAVLLDVVDAAGFPAAGDAPAAALLAAAYAAKRGVKLDPGLTIAGACSAGAVTLSSRPAWPLVADALARRPVQERQLVPVRVDGHSHAEVVRTARAVIRVVAAPTRRRRLVVAGAGSIVAAGVAATVLVTPVRPQVAADRLAARAESVLASSPLRSARLAAESLSTQRTDAAEHAALRIVAASPFTLTTGQERGALLAVGIDGDGTITTVSRSGRATRWTLHGNRVKPHRAVPLPRRFKLRAMSPSGRWLLLQPGDGDQPTALMIDAAGWQPTRRIALSAASRPVAISSSAPSVIASAKKRTGLSVVGDEHRVPRIDEEVSALRFSPNGRYLALGSRTGKTIVLTPRDGVWTPVRPWRQDLTPIAGNGVSHIDVDDAATTLAEGELQRSLHERRWRSLRAIGERKATEGIGGALANSTLDLSSDHGSVTILDHSLGKAAAVVARIASPVDARTVHRIASMPALGRVVVAQPDGLFAVLDMRGIQPAPFGVVTGSASLSGRRLSAVTGTKVGTKVGTVVTTWDLDTGRRVPTDSATILGRGAVIAEVSGDGRVVVNTSAAADVVVRDNRTGARLDTLRAGPSRVFLNVATSRDGRVVAAIDHPTGALTVWRRPSAGRRGMVAFQGPPLARDGRPVRPAPVAVAPDGRHVVYGTDSVVFIRSLADGAQRRLPTVALGRAARARFTPDGRRLLLAGERGALDFSGAGWRRVRVIRAPPAQDALGLPGGRVALASAAGLQIATPTGRNLVMPLPASPTRLGAGTLLAPPASSTLVAHGGIVPMVVIPAPTPSATVLCRLAGGRTVVASGCSSRPALPRARSARSGGHLHDSGTVLSADGLGPIRFARRLPPQVAQLAGHRAGHCAVRAVRGRGVAISTYDGRVESIGLFDPRQVDPKPARLDDDVVTDLGLAPGNAQLARSIYGKPVVVQGTHASWRQRASDGQLRDLRVSTASGAKGPQITMSMQQTHCRPWR